MYISNRFVFIFLLLGWTVFIICCTPDEQKPKVPEKEKTEVQLDLAKLPYGKLSDYRFFKGLLKDQTANERVLPYTLSSSLFTDYALKKRFVYLPEGQKAEYQSDEKILLFPVGTALIKTFYYENVQPKNERKIIETRVMVRKESGWIFAEYVWNEEQTEAYLQLGGSTVPITWRENDNSLLQTNYRIPSETECLTCHKQQEIPIPIGPKPQNMNLMMEDEEGTYNQLQKWIEQGYLANNLPQSIVSTIDYTDATQPLAKRIRSYLDINCAHCHHEGSHCDYRPLRLAFSETNSDSNLGICVLPDESVGATYKYLVWPTKADNSVMHLRLSATDEQLRMPLLGRSLVHEEGLALLKEWINNLPPCN